MKRTVSLTIDSEILEDTQNIAHAAHRSLSNQIELWLRQCIAQKRKEGGDPTLSAASRLSEEGDSRD